MLAAVFAVMMALSRVYLRAHWLSDVAAGVALGAAVAVAAFVRAAIVAHAAASSPSCEATISAAGWPLASLMPN